MALEKLMPEISQYPEVASMTTAPAGYLHVANLLGVMTQKDEAGVETPMSGAGGGGMTDFTLDADTGTPQTVGDGETVIFTGGDGIDTSVGATNEVAFAVNNTVIRTTGTQSIGAGLTIDTPTIADFTNAQHNHTNAAGGGQLTDAALSAAVGIGKGGTGATTAAGARANLDLEVGVDVQAWDADLDTIAGLAKTKGNILVANGTNWTVVGVGADGQVLVADSADAEGMVWQNASVAANDTHKFATNQTTTSGTFVDVDATNAAITATLIGGSLRKTFVQFNFAGLKTTAGIGYFRITDGTNNSPDIEIANDAVRFLSGVSYIFTGLAAGSTTFKLQYRTSDANAVVVRAEVELQMLILEMP